MPKRRKRKINNFGRLSLQAQDICIYNFLCSAPSGRNSLRRRDTQISGDYIRARVCACVQPCNYSEQDEVTEVPESLSSQLIIFSTHRVKKSGGRVGGWLKCVHCNLGTLHNQH